MVYVGGTKLVGANAWEINSTNEVSEAPEFQDTWKKHVTGLLTWSGTITAWDQADDKILFTAATGGTSVALIIYPDASDTSKPYSPLVPAEVPHQQFPRMETLPATAR
jgi:hypothetical protein